MLNVARDEPASLKAITPSLPPQVEILPRQIRMLGPYDPRSLALPVGLHVLVQGNQFPGV